MNYDSNDFNNNIGGATTNTENINADSSFSGYNNTDNSFTEYNTADNGNADSNFSDNDSSDNKNRNYKRSEVVVLKKSTVSVIALISVVVIVAAAIGGGLFVSGMNSIGFFNKNAPIVQNSGYTIEPTGEMGTAEAIAKKALDSVVGITTNMQGQDMFGQYGETSGQGTGIIVHPDGYILTNSHVINDGDYNKIEVLLADGQSVEAKSLWNDDSIDLAIIKVDVKGLTPATIGDSDAIQIGSYVAAIGNPLGLEFKGSVTQGIVSGLNRSITASSGSKFSLMEGMIQVDAAINSGNSGGPLLNNRGEVIGINTAKASAEGMGFAIPINTAAPIIEKVIATGSFQRAYMGISTMNAAEVKNQYPDMNLDIEKGAFVQDVTSGSPADKAGLKMKDVVIALNGKAVETSTGLIKELLNYAAGDTVEITYIRDGKEAKTKVTLATQTEIYGENNSSNNSPGNNEGNSPGNNGSDIPGGNGGNNPDDYYADEFWEDFFGR